MYRPDYLMMTPGPSLVKENVMKARSEFFGNPDLDNDFFKFYDELTEKLAKIFKTKKNNIVIMSGEGMLGLDSACASLIEKDDKVLVLENGIFGKGFEDLVKIYGGLPTTLSFHTKKGIDIDKLEEFLKENNDFKYATLVHCDTPTGVLNDVEKICKMLKSCGIMTIVDTVAAIGGNNINVDEWGIDIALAASQKVFSAPPGLTIVSISDKAWEVIENRVSPIPSFYCNLSYWKNVIENKLFPYTMPASDIIGLSVAIDNILEEGLDNVLKRHEDVSLYCQNELKKLGLDLYLEDDFAATVTAFYKFNNYSVKDVLKILKEDYKIVIGGSYGEFGEYLLRIGHMGEGAKFQYIDKVISAIEEIKNR